MSKLRNPNVLRTIKIILFSQKFDVCVHLFRMCIVKIPTKAFVWGDIFPSLLRDWQRC